MNANALLRKLTALGAEIDRSHGKGSHAMVKLNGRVSFIPLHGLHQAPTGTLRSICRQLDIDPHTLCRRNSMLAMSYPVDVVKKDALFRVIFPDFDATETFGESRLLAMEAAADLLETMISARIAEGIDLPLPSPAHRRPMVRPSSMTALKAAVYQTLRVEGITRAELARRLGWKWQQVAKLLDPRHRSRFDQLELALDALGRRIVVAVDAA
ncbi:MAG: type II toxin-antitoxin system HicA family toxin [Magnetococcus sp. YQC-3]